MRTLKETLKDMEESGLVIDRVLMNDDGKTYSIQFKEETKE